MSNQEIITSKFPTETIYSEQGGVFSISYVSQETKESSWGTIPLRSCGNSGRDFEGVLDSFTQNMVDSGWDINNKIWE